MGTTMRTSYSQFKQIVEFMERHGDLSKNPEGTHVNSQRWEKLIEMLNADASGNKKSGEKWRKVWSDFKNNTKKKAFRIHKAGPDSSTRLTDLEQRVITIMSTKPVHTSETTQLVHNLVSTQPVNTLVSTQPVHTLVSTQAATGLINIPEVGIKLEHEIDWSLQSSPPSRSESPLTTGGTGASSPTSAVVYVVETIEAAVEDDAASTAISEGRREPSSEGRREPSSEGRREPSSEGRREPSSEGRREPSSEGRREPSQEPSPTLVPPSPRLRRIYRPRLGPRRSPPTQRRMPKRSELALQEILKSDREWRTLQRELERDRNRIREEELRMQGRWLDLFGQFLLLGNRLSDILEKNNNHNNN
ncbi:uncharacterized protein LOC135073112 [Ostrinia nubilalis]|uniref:uncharacterized protein LOC135073112 n=1 Tax=Ostrinia nubilalis TaxID=29057 RepID=UPI003082365D